MRHIVFQTHLTKHVLTLTQVFQAFLILEKLIAYSTFSILKFHFFHQESFRILVIQAVHFFLRSLKHKFLLLFWLAIKDLNLYIILTISDKS